MVHMFDLVWLKRTMNIKLPLFILIVCLISLRAEAQTQTSQSAVTVLPTPSQPEKVEIRAEEVPQPKSIQEVKSMQLGTPPEAKPYTLPKTNVATRSYDGKEAAPEKEDALGAPNPQEETSGAKFKEGLATFGKVFLKLFKGSSIRVGA